MAVTPLLQCHIPQGPDFTKYLTIMPKLRSTYDVHLIYKTSYEESNVLLKYDSLAKF